MIYRFALDQVECIRGCPTVLPVKSDSDVMFCSQCYQGLIIDRSLCIDPINRQDRINTQVIYRFALDQVECIRGCPTVLPAKSDSDVMFCLQCYPGLIIDRSLVY